METPDIAVVVVIGEGSVGCEVACMLAYEMGKKDVAVIEMLPHFMKGVCTSNRGHLIHHPEKAGVNLLNYARLKAVTERSVRVVRNMSRTVPDPYVTWSPLLPENVKNPLSKRIKVEERELEMEADLVVLAVGLRPDDSLYEDCVRDAVAPKVHNIGDSFSVGRVF